MANNPPALNGLLPEPPIRPQLQQQSMARVGGNLLGTHKTRLLSTTSHSYHSPSPLSLSLSFVPPGSTLKNPGMNTFGLPRDPPIPLHTAGGKKCKRWEAGGEGGRREFTAVRYRMLFVVTAANYFSAEGGLHTTMCHAWNAVFHRFLSERVTPSYPFPQDRGPAGTHVGTPCTIQKRGQTPPGRNQTQPNCTQNSCTMNLRAVHHWPHVLGSGCALTDQSPAVTAWRRLGLSCPGIGTASLESETP